MYTLLRAHSFWKEPLLNWFFSVTQNKAVVHRLNYTRSCFLLFLKNKTTIYCGIYPEIPGYPKTIKLLIPVSRNRNKDLDPGCLSEPAKARKQFSHKVSLDQIHAKNKIPQQGRYRKEWEGFGTLKCGKDAWENSLGIISRAPLGTRLKAKPYESTVNCRAFWGGLVLLGIFLSSAFLWVPATLFIFLKMAISAKSRNKYALGVVGTKESLEPTSPGWRT